MNVTNDKGDRAERCAHCGARPSLTLMGGTLIVRCVSRRCPVKPSSLQGTTDESITKWNERMREVRPSGLLTDLMADVLLRVLHLIEHSPDMSCIVCGQRQFAASKGALKGLRVGPRHAKDCLLVTVLARYSKERSTHD